MQGIPNPNIIPEPLEQIYNVPPSPGYPDLAPNRFVKAKKPFRLAKTLRFFEPAERKPGASYAEAVRIRNEMQQRQQALLHPDTRKFQHITPAYSKILPSTGRVFPENFSQIYGMGPRPDHYYFGLTPKDVLLAMGSVAPATPAYPVMKRGIGATRYHDQEIQMSRQFFYEMSGVFYQGKIPTNLFMRELLNRSQYAIQKLVTEKQGDLSQDTLILMNSVVNWLRSIDMLMVEKNGDELMQSFIHHLVLSTMTTYQLEKRQLEMMRETAPLTEYMAQAGGEEEGPKRTELGRILSLLARSSSIWDTLQELFGLVKEMVGPAQPVFSPPPGYRRTAPAEYEYQERATSESIGTPATARAARMPASRPEGLFTKRQQQEKHVHFEEPMKEVPMTRYSRDFIAPLNEPLDPKATVKIADGLRFLFSRLSSNTELLEVMTGLGAMITELGTISGMARGQDNTIPLLYHDANRKAMLLDLKELVERFSGGYTLDALIAVLDDFQSLYQEDFYLRDYLNEVGMFIKRSMAVPEAGQQSYLESLDYVPKGIDLIERGRQLLSNEFYGPMTNALLNEVFDLFQSIQNDPVSSQFYQATQQMMSAFLISPMTGEYTLKTDLFKDFKNMLIPFLMNTFKFIPLPRIEISDANMDLILDNIVLRTENILPNLIEFNVKNCVQMSARTDLPDTYFNNVLELNILQIQTDLRNVEFAYRKKSFPRFEDLGLADILLAGNGLSLYTQTAYDPNLWYTTLVPLEIKADIDILKIQLHDSQHNTLYKLLGKSLTAALKKRLSESIEEKVYELIARMDAIVTEVSQRMGKRFIVGNAEKSVQIW